MTLDPQIKVDMPEKGVVICPNGKYNPVYHVLEHYRTESGSARSRRVCIGKRDQETGKLIPNVKYYELYRPTDNDETVVTYASTRSIGVSFLIGAIMDQLGLKEILDECLGGERSERVQTAALYMVARNNVFDDVLGYCGEYTLFETPLTSQSASKLFASIRHDDRMRFFKLWIKRQKLGSFLAYDVTSFSTYAKDIVESEYGYNRDNERLPQINLGCFISEDNGRPVFYVNYCGSITDSSHLPYMMSYNDDLKISDVTFVLDRGFCSTKNIKFMTEIIINIL
jgi:hypothetical protein